MSKGNRKFTKEKSQLLKTLLAQAQRKGYIQADTIKSRFARYNPSEEELEDYFRQFEDSGVDVIYVDTSNECYEEASISEEELVSEYKVPTSDSHSSSIVDPMQLYLNEIHKFPTLTHKETLALIHKVRAGDTAAREYLINCNLKFAFTVALKFAYTGVPLFDLVQEANLGLTNAVDRYNPHRGTRFTSYAIFWIRMFLLEYVNEATRLIRIPTYLCMDIANLHKLESAFDAEHQRKPTDDELATLSGQTIARIKYLRKIDLNIISADLQPDEEQDGVLADTFTDFDIDEDPHKEFYQKECHGILFDCLNKLRPRRRDVVILRVGLNPDEYPQPLNLEETGKVLGISKERVRQLENLALNKLRRMPGITALHAYLQL